jgi:alpha-methylacyl-CoA racemase
MAVLFAAGRMPMSGPLAGVRIIEFAGLGPVPFAGMMLADAGVDIIRIDRADRAAYPPSDEPDSDLLNRGRRSVAVNLKHPGGAELVLRLAGQADGLMEGFRPGVAERLGFGPAPCLSLNRALVYGRMTGWGQSGPMARSRTPAPTRTKDIANGPQAHTDSAELRGDARDDLR